MRRWVRFRHSGQTRCGILADDDRSIQVHGGGHIGSGCPTGASVPLQEAVLLTPTEPSKYIGLWNNFGELADKLGQARPQEPLYFFKSSNSFLEPGGTLRRPPGYTGRIFYEGELGIIIGARCSAVSEDEAPRHILGYTCVNDVTASDHLSSDPSFPQWARAKSCDSFGPFGPCVAEGLDWMDLRIRTIVNGRERQNYPAADMILSPGRIVSLLSRELTLLPGDLIACGTSTGALPIKPGALIEVVIDGIGTLRNTMDTTEAKE